MTTIHDRASCCRSVARVPGPLTCCVEAREGTTRRKLTEHARARFDSE